MNKLNSLYVSLVALVVAIAALVMCVFCCCGNKGAMVEEALNNNPEMIINAMQKYEQKMRDEAQAQAQKLIMDSIEEVNNDADTPFVGNQDAKVVLVEFFDYSCGYCHRLFPGLKAVIENNPDVKVAFKALTFVSPVSEYAAKAALAANMQGKYIEMHNGLFQVNGRLTEAKVDEVAAQIGLDMDRYRADLGSERVRNALKKNAELANKIQVNGVPALILNGTMLQTIDGNVVQDALNEAKAAQ